jgi:hypothetical protein
MWNIRFWHQILWNFFSYSAPCCLVRVVPDKLVASNIPVWETLQIKISVRVSSTKHLLFCQRVNTAISLPADDVHHYVIPQKLLLTNRFYFQHTSSINAPVGKRKGWIVSSSEIRRRVVRVNRRFGWTYRLHLQGRKSNFSKKPASKQAFFACVLGRISHSSMPEIMALPEDLLIFMHWKHLCY